MDINTEIFRRTLPHKKLDIIDKLTENELLNITESTITKMVKDIGTRPSHSRNKMLYLTNRIGNNWNSTVEGVGIFRGILHISFYIQYQNTDTTRYVQFKEFLTGKEFRGYLSYDDRYGNKQTSYYTYNESDKARVIRNLCIEYIIRKYASKLTKQNNNE